MTAVEVEGEPAWMLARDVEEATKAAVPGSVRLLPAFDPHVIGASRHAGCLLPGAALRPRVYRPQGWLSPVLLVEGRMEGVWRHEQKGGRVVVQLEAFSRLAPRVRCAAEGEAERLARFLGGELELSWGKVHEVHGSAGDPG